MKPKNYINIGANAQGDLTELLVKEGDHVRKGQLLAKIEDVQPQADVQAQRAALSSAEAQSSASEAGVKAADENINTMRAALEHDKADLDRMKADYQRAEQLYNEKLGAKQDFEMKKYTYDAQVAALAESQARVVQAQAQRQQTAAQLASAQRQIAQAQANLTRFDDILRKHNAYAPLDGVVTNLPGARGGIGGDGHPELRGQYDYDDRRYVADHRRSESGRNRYREHPSRISRPILRSTRFPTRRTRVT